MGDQLPVLDYADRHRKHLLPSRNDWGVAVFILIAVVAGMIGIVGLIGCLVEFATAPPPVPISFVALGLLYYGGSIALAWGAVRLAKRRARVK